MFNELRGRGVGATPFGLRPHKQGFRGSSKNWYRFRLRLRLPTSLFELRRDKTTRQVAILIVFSLPLFRRTDSRHVSFLLLPLGPLNPGILVSTTQNPFFTTDHFEKVRIIRMSRIYFVRFQKNSTVCENMGLRSYPFTLSR